MGIRMCVGVLLHEQVSAGEVCHHIGHGIEDELTRERSVLKVTFSVDRVHRWQLFLACHLRVVFAKGGRDVHRS
jgi:hypothetical protein